MDREAHDLAAARRLIAAIEEGVVEAVRPWRYGIAFLTPSLPLVWDVNYLLVDSGDRAAAPAVADEADAIAREAGIADTAIVVEDEQLAERLLPGLRELGFELNRFVFMRLRAAPSAPAHQVVAASFAEIASSRRELALEDFPGRDDLADELAELDRRAEVAAGGRWFAVRGEEEGGILARAWLRERDGVGQVEDVATTRAARGRGLGSTVVAAAARASVAAGNRLTFVVADADETTPRFYEQLGFEAMGLNHRFVRRLR